MEKPWVSKSNGKQSINVNAQNSPKRSYIRLSWQSKTTVLIMNNHEQVHVRNTTTQMTFLKLSTTICMSMRPLAEDQPGRCQSERPLYVMCAAASADKPLQKVVENSTPLAHHLVPGYRRTGQIVARCQKPCDGCGSGTKSVATMVKTCNQPQNMAKRLCRAPAEWDPQ